MAINCSLTLRLLWRFLWEGRPKLIMAEGIQEQVVARVIRAITRTPYAVHVHEIYRPQELSRVNRLFLCLEGSALRSAEFLIFPEKTREELYAEQYHLHNSRYVVANCPRYRPKIRPRDIRSAFALGDSRLVMAYMGGIGPENLIEEGIEAVGDMAEVCFLVWGWGNPAYLGRLRDVIKRRNLVDRVKLLGEVGDDKWTYLAGCDLSYCVYRPVLWRLQHSVTASNKLMEAMACSIPVITSGEPAYKAFVEQYNVGVCADSLTVTGIAGAIQKLASDSSLRQQQGANGRRLHETLFHYERQFAEVIKEYDRMGFSLSPPPTGPPSM